MMPILNPAGVQEIIDYALYGWAMSRFTGAWAALKCMHETVESTGVVDGSLDRVQIVTPDRFRDAARAGSTSASPTPSSARKRACTTTSATPCSPSCAPTSSTRSSPRAAARRRSASSPPARPISTCARRFDELGIDEIKCNDLGLRLFKIACPWPIGAPGIGRLRARARSHHRGRGEALADRSAGARGACTAPPISRSASARRTSRATGCSRSRARSIPTTSPSASASGCCATAQTTSSPPTSRG